MKPFFLSRSAAKDPATYEAAKAAAERAGAELVLTWRQEDPAFPWRAVTIKQEAAAEPSKLADAMGRAEAAGVALIVLDGAP